MLIKKIQSHFLKVSHWRSSLPKYLHFTQLSNRSNQTEDSYLWMLHEWWSVLRTLTIQIITHNFVFKLNLRIQVDSRINLYIHVIDTLWSTNIFQFFCAPRIDNKLAVTNPVETLNGVKHILSAQCTINVITTSNETQHPWKITLSQSRFYLNVLLN